MLPRTAEIKVVVELDADDLPTRIEWQASEAQRRTPTSCESMMLSFWDSESRTIAAIDLWIKDTSVEDMNLYFYQAIHRMADTYLRATKNTSIANSIHGFGNEFGEALGLISGNAE
jgi:gliding motility-associated protein GldC